MQIFCKRSHRCESQRRYKGKPLLKNFVSARERERERESKLYDKAV